MWSSTTNPSLSSPASSFRRPHFCHPSLSISLSSSLSSFSSNNLIPTLRLVSFCCQSPNLTTNLTVSAMSDPSSSSSSSSSAIDFLTLCHRLKVLFFSAWTSISSNFRLYFFIFPFSDCFVLRVRSSSR